MRYVRNWLSVLSLARRVNFLINIPIQIQSQQWPMEIFHRLTRFAKHKPREYELDQGKRMRVFVLRFSFPSDHSVAAAIAHILHEECGDLLNTTTAKTAGFYVILRSHERRVCVFVWVWVRQFSMKYKTELWSCSGRVYLCEYSPLVHFYFIFSEIHQSCWAFAARFSFSLLFVRFCVRCALCLVVGDSYSK